MACGIVQLRAEEGMMHLERQTDRQEGLAAAYQQVVGEVSRVLQATSTANRHAAASTLPTKAPFSAKLHVHLRFHL